MRGCVTLSKAFMIDNIAVFIFSTAIVYTVLRAVRLDKRLPWFSSNIDAELKRLEQEENQAKEKKRPGKSARK